MVKILTSENIVERENLEIERHVTTGIANIITGVRRCGKSILAFQLARRGNFGYVNFEDERLSMEAGELNKVLEAVYSLKGDVDTLVFDEIQNVPGWERFIARILPAKKVVLTGSNARLMSKELATHLTGRHIDFALHPFSFREFLLYRNVKIKEENLYSTRGVAMIKRLWEEYMETGGFPLALRLGRLFLLENFRDIVERDVIQRYRVKHPSKLRELARYLLSNPSSEITYNRLKRMLSLGSANTVSDWISFLENSYLIFKLERFSLKLKEAVLAPKKIFSIDTGLSNAVGFRTSENRGRLMENAVAVELLRRRDYWKREWEIFYWKDHRQREVDFVVKEGPRVKHLIQVCWEVTLETEKREVEPLLLAMKEFGLKEGLILTFDKQREETVDGRKIIYMPVWRWMMKTEDVDHPPLSKRSLKGVKFPT
ncbi:MAG: ATP-binding protein [Candidatus Hadarchaeum sp.]|uniref:ATP-binding protein n=1 Tax=Candidatus Hadarchaeum sp. TaxID=2883567 RepID=UPI003D12A407